MNALVRIRIEKAAADCGFDLTPYDDEEKIVLRSSAFPESAREKSEKNRGLAFHQNNMKMIESKTPAVLRLVDVGAAGAGSVVGEQLQRDDVQDG